jgi:hypothetical protein
MGTSGLGGHVAPKASPTWTLTKRKKRKIQAVDMKFFEEVFWNDHRKENEMGGHVAHTG